MDIRDIIKNQLVQDESLIWLLKGHDHFEYSDGLKSEKYLKKVFSEVKDLSSGSRELEEYINDWPSEYHLSHKRAQLLSGFRFDKSFRVLEVGGGCGAITRFLGETFNEVISIEGSLKRARLAKLRNKDLKSVSILCAPFQDLIFKEKFDILFCIGVYEYSGMFIDSSDPYNAVLKYFYDMLTPSGIVVLAIENQFGLKYFNSHNEDHLGIPFDGLEGYHRYGDKVRTFGREELNNKLKHYFIDTNFYYPFPDYKVPNCIITEEFLLEERAGELVSQVQSRDYLGNFKSRWDEPLVLLELAKNKMLPFFSNSFLVLAGKERIKGVSFDPMAVMFSSDRKKVYSMKTEFYKDVSGRITVSKNKLNPLESSEENVLRMVESISPWIDSYSLQTILHMNCKAKELCLSDIFSPCKKWIDFLIGVANYESGINYLSGEYIDCIWSNFYPNAERDPFIDNEWIWNEKVKLNVVVIRAIYTFLFQSKRHQNANCLKTKKIRHLIYKIANAIGVTLLASDFEEFIEIESKLQSVVFGTSQKNYKIYLRLYLFNSRTLLFWGLRKKIVKKLNHSLKIWIKRRL